MTKVKRIVRLFSMEAEELRRLILRASDEIAPPREFMAGETPPDASNRRQILVRHRKIASPPTKFLRGKKAREELLLAFIELTQRLNSDEIARLIAAIENLNKASGELLDSLAKLK